MGLGRAVEAVPPLERALTVPVRAPVNLADREFSLGWALIEVHRDLPRARTLLTSARKAFILANRTYRVHSIDELLAKIGR
jgi:hypothetical protein